MCHYSRLITAFSVIFVVFAVGCNRRSQPGNQEKNNETSTPPPHVTQTEGKYSLARNQSAYVDYPKDGVQLGNGWDSPAGQKTTQSCIQFAKIDDRAESKQLELREFADKASLLNALDVSAEVQVKSIAGFGGNAKTHYVSSVQTSEEQSNFVVHAVVNNGATYVGSNATTHLDLMPEFAKLARDNLGEFIRQCGDTYVESLFGGATLAGVLTFNVYSIDEKKEISTSMTASGWGVLDTNVNVSQTMKKYSESKKMSISYFEQGGSGDPIPTNQDQLKDKVNQLPSLAKDSPQYWTIGLHRYDDLPSWPVAKGDWAFADYAVIADQYNKLTSLHETVVEMLSQPDNYVLGHGVERDDLVLLESDLLGHVKKIAGRAKDCLQSSGKNCKLDPADDVVDYTYRIKLPVRKGSFNADTALINAQAAAGAAQAALNNKTAELKKNTLYQIINSDPRIMAAATAQERGALGQANQQLNALTNAYPEAIRQAVLAQWIAIPVNIRCKQDYTRSDCIDSGQIDAYGKQIIVK